MSEYTTENIKIEFLPEDTWKWITNQKTGRMEIRIYNKNIKEYDKNIKDRNEDRQKRKNKGKTIYTKKKEHEEEKDENREIEWK